MRFVGGRTLSARQLARALVDTSEGELDIDLSDVAFCDPSGLVVVAVLLDRAAEEDWPTDVVPPRSSDVARYLSRMGLQDALDAAEARCLLPSVRHHPRRERFVELQRLDGDHPGDDIGDLIYNRLGSWDDGHLQMTIYNALFELAINVEEHAQRPGFIAAQCYENERVAIAVGDFGIGIHGSLANAGHVFSRPSKAVIEAVTTRLSSKPMNGGAGLGSVVKMFEQQNGHAIVVTGGESVTFRKGAKPQPSMVGYPNPGTFLFGELRWR